MAFTSDYLTDLVYKDDPMHVWVPYEQDFLDELLRREEFGSDTLHPHCATCRHRWKTLDQDMITEEDTISDLFRCESCGEFWECRDCCLIRHQQTPLHCVLVRGCRFIDDLG